MWNYIYTCHLKLPFSVGWQELKDLFRAAGMTWFFVDGLIHPLCFLCCLIITTSIKTGNIIRADILVGPDRRPKGSGTVLFETAGDAANAICTLCLSIGFV